MTLTKSGEALAARLIADAEAFAARFKMKPTDAMQLAILMDIRNALLQSGQQAITTITQSGQTITITPTIFTQLIGYKKHFFISLPFTNTAAAFVDLPAICQVIIVEPTAAAFVEFDQTPNTSPNGSPVLQALQGLAASVQVKRVYVRGQSAGGYLYIWAFWQ